MGSITSGFSQYVDQFIQPLTQSLQSYIRDDTRLLELLSSYSWEPSYLWVSLDVQSLYTSIPHDVELGAIQSFLCQDPMLNPRQASFIVEATSFCLTHNYFIFENYMLTSPWVSGNPCTYGITIPSPPTPCSIVLWTIHR